MTTPRISSISARHRLVIGNDRHGLDGGAGQLALDLLLDMEFRGEVTGGTETPAILDHREMHATIGIEVAQFLQQAGNICILRHARLQGIDAERLGRSEENGLEEALQLKAIVTHHA